MTTGAPGIAPDVSSVLDIVHKAESLAKRDAPEWVRIEARRAIQQAAEQACYRYALAVLERLWQSAYHKHCHVDDRGCDVAQEIAAVQQLLARSA